MQRCPGNPLLYNGSKQMGLWRGYLLSHIGALPGYSLLQVVRGHPSVSLLPLSSPTLPLFICIPPPHLCTSSKDHTSSRRPSRSRHTECHRLPASPSACTSATSDEPRMHWDRPADNPNTQQTLEYTKDKYNVKIVKRKSLLRSHQQPM
jgi:hypothetical protein